jgi:hypothetical protein
MDDEQFERLTELRLSRRDLCTSLHEAGHAMLADALNVDIERVWITGLYDKTIKPQAGVLLAGTYPIPKAIVIALAGRAVDETLDVDNSKCEAGFEQYETDECRLQECLVKSYAPNVLTDEQSSRYHRETHILRHGWVSLWVKRNEEPIRRFAEALKEARVLTGCDLERVINEAWEGSKPRRFCLRLDI